MCMILYVSRLRLPPILFFLVFFSDLSLFRLVIARKRRTVMSNKLYTCTAHRHAYSRTPNTTMDENAKEKETKSAVNVCVRVCLHCIWYAIYGQIRISNYGLVRWLSLIRWSRSIKRNKQKRMNKRTNQPISRQSIMKCIRWKWQSHFMIFFEFFFIRTPIFSEKKINGMSSKCNFDLKNFISFFFHIKFIGMPIFWCINAINVSIAWRYTTKAINKQCKHSNICYPWRCECVCVRADWCILLYLAFERECIAPNAHMHSSIYDVRFEPAWVSVCAFRVGKANKSAVEQKFGLENSVAVGYFSWNMHETESIWLEAKEGDAGDEGCMRWRKAKIALTHTSMHVTKAR